ncbi:MAG TPA: 3-isopropylmalate dehydratase small subunit, partial [Gammaproteobacteria bacterium]|nr:3-isopropylmalate dehydratase small subunit [Gammaproteobacteria bacterium]
GFEITLDLQKQKVITEDGDEYSFEVDAFRKHCLLNGLDDISLTLQHVDEIKAYEEKTKQSAPWLF